MKFQKEVTGTKCQTGHEYFLYTDLFFLETHVVQVICEDLNYTINVKTNKTKNDFYHKDLGVKNVGSSIHLYKNEILWHRGFYLHI